MTKKLLGPEVLVRAMRDTIELAREQGVSVALAGGAAMYLAYGSQRLTADIDFVADAPLRQVRRLKALSFGGQRLLVGGVETDIIVRNDEFEALYDAGLYHAALNRELGARVVRAEYLFAMKMLAGRDKDHEDMAYLIVSGEVDLPRARKVIVKFLGHYAAREFDALVEEARWMAQRKNPRRRHR